MGFFCNCLLFSICHPGHPDFSNMIKSYLMRAFASSIEAVECNPFGSMLLNIVLSNEA